MIAFVKGNFVDKSPARVIVDVNGVGYELQISLNTYAAIQPIDSGRLLTYLHITENAQTLYGFYELSEKQLFLHLIAVSGVGASTARMMLSGLKPDEIIKAIVQNNVRQLEGIKGIGKKTAERLIVELKDKLAKQFDGEKSLVAHTPQNITEKDALDALIALGIARPMAEKALAKALKSVPAGTADIQLLIKAALQNI